MFRSMTIGRGVRAEGLMSILSGMREIRRQRTALENLDPHLPDDIGTSRAEAWREPRRPFWDAPRHWWK